MGRGLRVGRAGYRGLGRSRRAAWRWRRVDTGDAHESGASRPGLEGGWAVQLWLEDDHEGRWVGSWGCMHAPQVWDLGRQEEQGWQVSIQSQHRLGSLQLMGYGSAGMTGDGQGSQGPTPWTLQLLL